jgi:predicted transporter
MDTLIKEYGGMVLAILGGIIAFGLITLVTLNWAGVSRKMIANMTGVSYDQTQYIDDVEE